MQGVSNKTVNLELGVLRGVLKRAKRWYLLAEDIRPLPVNRNVGRAMSYEEKVQLVKTAASRPEWESACLAMTLALNTTMRACEIKGLRWRDVSLVDRTLTIRRSKTVAGQRVIPLNFDAWTCILGLWERAKRFNGGSPDHFVFSACEGGKIDPVNPQKSWRSAWRSLRKAAGLKNLRFHDLRHHAITELAESQASEQTIMAIAGHVSPQMLEHYSHIRLEAKRRALEAISTNASARPRRDHADASYDTKNDTICTTAGESAELTGTKEWSGRVDLNHRPPGPEPGALARLSHAPTSA
jgi:integrase